MKIVYPPHGWLVASRNYGIELESLDGEPLNIPSDHQGCYEISADWRGGGLVMPLWYPVDVLRRHPDVDYVQRMWYLMDEDEMPDGVVLPPDGEDVDQCGFPFTMWHNRDTFMEGWALGKGCDAIRVLWEVYEGAEGDLRRMAGDVLDGETGVLPVLADAVEEAGHRHAKVVRKMVKANPAPKPPKGYVLPVDPDPDVTAVQRGVNGPCPGCGQANRRVAGRPTAGGGIVIRCKACRRTDKPK